MTRAARVRVFPSLRGRRLAFEYDVDERHRGALTVDYPFELDSATHNQVPAIALAVGVFLGQLCLAEQVDVDAPVAREMLATIAPLTEMLYDIRCWKDGVPLTGPPRVEGRRGSVAPPTSHPVDGRALLMFSGGKDSTLSALVLRANGLDVQALHLPLNLHAKDAEQRAVQRLSGRLELPTSTLSIAFPEFAHLSRSYATTWDAFPHYNAVPFGRDLLLAALAAPVALRSGASLFCMGHDHDCRTAYVSHQGKRIPRNDVEGIAGAKVVEAILERFAVPGLRMLPPLASITEHRILHSMFLLHPALMAETSFCFWGQQCGQCAKCLRYYLVQRVLGREDVLSFRVDPLQGHNCPELLDYFASNWSSDALFSDNVAYCLGRLVQRGDVRAGEVLLQRFADEVDLPDLDDVEQRLLARYEDSQVPSTWRLPELS